MKILKIIALLVAFVTTHAQAQNLSGTSDRTRKIEINNDNGELSIQFVNGEITEFTINDKPVAKDKYDEYQSIINDFAEEEEEEIALPTPPTPPAPPVDESNKSEELRAMMTEYLMNEGHLSSFEKFKIDLQKKYLKVNGKKMSREIHSTCLEMFEEVYGEPLNNESQVKFRKSKNKSRSSLTINE